MLHHVTILVYISIRYFLDLSAILYKVISDTATSWLLRLLNLDVHVIYIYIYVCTEFSAFYEVYNMVLHGFI